MNSDEYDKIEQIILELRIAAGNRSSDARAMYRANGYFAAIDAPIGKRLDEVLSQFDKHKIMQDFDSAKEQVERAVGLLEGYLMGQSRQNDTNSSSVTLASFSLDRDEKLRVLQLASEMRKIVNESELFDLAYKVRIQKRISAVETEVNKPRGMFDVILGGISDIGEAFGKFGKDVKPLVERMEEIGKITRNKSAEYDQLPPPEEVKKLPPPDNDKN